MEREAAEVAQSVLLSQQTGVETTPSQGQSEETRGHCKIFPYTGEKERVNFGSDECEEENLKNDCNVHIMHI